MKSYACAILPSQHCKKYLSPQVMGDLYSVSFKVEHILYQVKTLALTSRVCRFMSSSMPMNCVAFVIMSVDLSSALLEV